MLSNEDLDTASQEAILIIALTPNTGVTVPVDSVCEQLLAEFPGAVVTAQNSFEAKRLLLEDLRQRSQERLRQGTLESWAWKTMDELNSAFDQAIVRSQRVELRSGPKKNLAIPLGHGTQLEGNVGAKFIQFQGNCRRSDLAVVKFVRVLESLNIGRVEVLEHNPKPSCSEDLGRE